MFDSKHKIINGNKKFTMSGFAFNLAHKYPKCIFYKVINKTLFSSDDVKGLEINPLTGIVYETSKLNESGV